MADRNDSVSNEKEVERLQARVSTQEQCIAVNVREYLKLEQERDRLRAALTDLEMAVKDLMREKDFEVSETLSTALDIAQDALK